MAWPLPAQALPVMIEPNVGAKPANIWDSTTRGGNAWCAGTYACGTCVCEVTNLYPTECFFTDYDTAKTLGGSAAVTGHEIAGRPSCDFPDDGEWNYSGQAVALGVSAW